MLNLLSSLQNSWMFRARTRPSPQVGALGRPVLQVNGLTLQAGQRIVLDQVSLELYPGQCLALLGASGAGKSLLLRAIAGHLPPGVRQLSGEIVLGGEPLLPEGTHRRGVPPPSIGWLGQHAQDAFDPLQSVGEHLAAAAGELRFMRPHPGIRSQRWLERLGLPPHCLHQTARTLSGGMARRAALAWALAGNAPLMLADEPSTGADALRLLDMALLLEGLKATGTALLLVTHELRLAQRLADQVRWLENAQLVARPLPDRLPMLGSRRGLRVAIQSHRPPRLELVNLHCQLKHSPEPLLKGLHWKLQPGERVGILGQSGAGKSTLAKVLAGLIAPTTGRIQLDGQPLHLTRPRVGAAGIQLVLQEPTAVAHPRLRVREALRETLAQHQPTQDCRSWELQCESGLEKAGLDHRAGALVETLSGGELRRLGMLRALLARPRLLILDEPTAGLDLLYRQKLMQQLNTEWAADTTVICISHDIEVLQAVCDRISVLHEGRWLEHLPAERLCLQPTVPAPPLSAFTQQLLEAWEALAS